jgi:hypothetical protein
MPLEALSFLAAIIGILSSGLLAYLAYSLNRQSQRATLHRSIGDLYGTLMKFRADYPEVMGLCDKWSSSSFVYIYRQKTKQDKLWVQYYTYAELAISFCNSVLYGRKTRLLDNQAYNQHYRPLVLMLLTEHYPFVSNIMTGPYLSSLIKEFIREAEKAGWNWNEDHLK